MPPGSSRWSFTLDLGYEDGGTRRASPRTSRGASQRLFSLFSRRKVSLRRGKLGGIPQVAGVFAPGELASPERGFCDQRGCKEKITATGGLVPPGRYLGLGRRRGNIAPPGRAKRGRGGRFVPRSGFQTSLRRDEPAGGVLCLMRLASAESFHQPGRARWGLTLESRL